MRPLMNRFHTLMLLSALCVWPLACTDDEGDAKPESNTSMQESPDPSKPENMTMNDAMTTQDACMMADPDCAYWFCRCEDGGVVNARLCDQGFCSGPGAICPDACVAFGRKSWTGFAGGGVKQDPPTQDPPKTDPTPPQDMGSTDPVAPMCETTFTGSSSSCDMCADEFCCDAMQRCDGNPECLAYWDCHLRDLYSREECDAQYPNGALDYDTLDFCMQDNCSSDCL